MLARYVLPVLIACLAMVSPGNCGRAEECDGHGVSTEYQITTGKANPIQVEITVDGQVVNPGSVPLNLQYRAVGTTITFHVGAYDEDTHVCQIPMSPVRNFIQDTEIAVEIYIKGTNGQPDQRINTTPYPLVLTSSVPTEEPRDRAWDGTWKIPATAIPEGDTQPVSLVGKRLVFKFAGAVDDVTCTAPKHKNSDDETVYLDSLGYTAELVVESLGIEIKTKRQGASSWDTADMTSIAVGCVSSPIHRADVEITTTPAQPGKMLPITFTAGRYTQGKDAILILNGVRIVARQDATPTHVATDSQGKLIGTLTSSDVLTHAYPCVVESLGVRRNVAFVWDNYAGDDYWDSDPPYLVMGKPITQTLSLSLDGIALNNHEVKFYVEKITYLDSDGLDHVIENRPDNPQDVSAFAEFKPATVRTDARGRAQTKLHAYELAGKEIVEVEMVAYDLSARTVSLVGQVAVAPVRALGGAAPLAAAAPDKDRKDSSGKDSEQDLLEIEATQEMAGQTLQFLIYQSSVPIRLKIANFEKLPKETVVNWDLDGNGEFKQAQYEQQTTGDITITYSKDADSKSNIQLLEKAENRRKEYMVKAKVLAPGKAPVIISKRLRVALAVRKVNNNLPANVTNDFLKDRYSFDKGIPGGLPFSNFAQLEAGFATFVDGLIGGKDQRQVAEKYRLIMGPGDPNAKDFGNTPVDLRYDPNVQPNPISGVQIVTTVLKTSTLQWDLEELDAIVDHEKGHIKKALDKKNGTSVSGKLYVAFAGSDHPGLRRAAMDTFLWWEEYETFADQFFANAQGGPSYNFMGIPDSNRLAPLLEIFWRQHSGIVEFKGTRSLSVFKQAEDNGDLPKGTYDMAYKKVVEIYSKIPEEWKDMKTINNPKLPDGRVYLRFKGPSPQK